MSKALTAKAVDAAKPDPKKRREIPDGGLPGLGQIHEIAILSKEGDGDPVKAAIVRERATKTRRAYNG